MDSGVAALLGAAIGGIASLLGGFFGPWLRARLDRRVRLADERATHRREGVIAFVDAIFALHASEPTPLTQRAAMTAQARVAVYTDPNESPALWACQRALACVLDEELRQFRPMILTGTQSALTDWARGTLSGADVLNDIEAHIRWSCGEEDPGSSADLDKLIERWAGHSYGS